MGKSLIIVESPTKIKTIKKFLNDDGFILESSLGHIRDLPPRSFGINVDEDFEPEYEVLSDKKQVIDKIIKAAKTCSTVYLSPDPDREGEAIAWHIASLLPQGTNIKRVTFNSITKEAVLKALDEPRNINIDLVNAQQARRLLDRIVGYKISPILARRIQKGKRGPGQGSLSAGRVQSVALKLVVDREREIEAFIPTEYWKIDVLLQNQEQKAFSAILHKVDGKKVEKESIEGKEVFLIPNEETAFEIEERVKQASFHIEKIERKEKRRNPVPPFITSTLQQEASRHYGFSSSKTMMIAQSLYEGIDMGQEGMEGLITYMRTDSVRIADEALRELRAYLQETFGKEYLNPSIRNFQSKKSAQEAHEAIRPTNLEHPPEKLKGFLDHDQFRLYSLIWKRYLASQMTPAVYDTLSVDILSNCNLLFRASGSSLKFPGFLSVYEEKIDEDDLKDEQKLLPDLEEGQKPDLLEVNKEQSFTRPPPRYTEASLVKELESSGIGRPSTYATIMNKIQSREYTVKENKRLKPTELGKVIAQMLETNFKQIMDIDFTAQMEDLLEKVAANEKNWKELLREFWKDFLPTVEIAEKEAFVPKIVTDIPCPECGSMLQKIWARNKYFYGCSGYPDCNYTTTQEELNFDKSDYQENFDWKQKCPICGSDTKIRHGRYGCFLGCSQYPKCKGIINVPKKGEDNIDVNELPPCPALDCPGKIIPKKSRFGKVFFSCSTFPECNVIVNEIEELADKYRDYPRTAYEKKTKGKKKTSAKKETKAKKKSPRKMPPCRLSKELQELIDADEIPRTEVIKKVWEYIKARGLQDPLNKKTIIPDEKLAKVLGSQDPINMFKMTSLLSQHIQKI